MKKGEDGRQISRKELERLRFQAIKLKKEGKKINDIAHSFGLHRCTVSSWFTKLKRFGKKSLKQKKAKGRSPKLNQNDKKQILNWLKNPATKYGFETPVWTIKRIQVLIKKNLEKSIHKSNVWEWVKKWGLTNQKPTRRSIQRDEKAVEKWKSEEWPNIIEHQRRWQAILYFQDESGISLTAVMGKTWAPKGKTPVVKTSGNRGRLCVTSAITPMGKMIFRIEKKRVNAEAHIDFLKQILRHHPNRKVIIIEDNAPCHKAKKVKMFVEKNKKKLAVYNIPPYSPELNPDEHVWAYLKEHKLKSHQAKNTAELKKLVRKKMHGIARKKSLIHSFFVGTYVV